MKYCRFMRLVFKKSLIKIVICLLYVKLKYMNVYCTKGEMDYYWYVCYVEMNKDFEKLLVFRFHFILQS